MTGPAGPCRRCARNARPSFPFLRRPAPFLLLLLWLRRLSLLLRLLFRCFCCCCCSCWNVQRGPRAWPRPARTQARTRRTPSRQRKRAVVALASVVAVVLTQGLDAVPHISGTVKTRVANHRVKLSASAEDAASRAGGKPSAAAPWRRGAMTDDDALMRGEESRATKGLLVRYK